MGGFSLEISDRCVDRLAVEISWADGSPVTTKIVIPGWRCLYLTLDRDNTCPPPPDPPSTPATPRHRTTLGIHLYRGAIRWSLAAPGDHRVSDG